MAPLVFYTNIFKGVWYVFKKSYGNVNHCISAMYLGHCYITGLHNSHLCNVFVSLLAKVTVKVAMIYDAMINITRLL